MKKLRRPLRPLALALLALGLSATPTMAEPSVTLEKIMAHSRWIGQWPEEVRFSPAGGRILAVRKKDPRGQEVLELDRQGRILTTHDTGSLPGELSRGKNGVLFSWRGDLFLESPQRQRLTQTKEKESGPRWLDANSYTYQLGDKVMLENRATGAHREVAELVFEGDPNAEESNFVGKQQERLFPVLKEREEADKRVKEAGGIPKLYLGTNRELVRAELAADSRQLLLVTAPENKAKQDKMPDYVTDDGYLTTQELRVKVGDDPAANQELALVNLADKSRRSLSLEGLPTWRKDRAIRVEDARWSDNGRLALMLLSQEFKDRWLVEVDFGAAKLNLIEHLHDPAWHSWDLNEFGWTPDGKTFWYQSEKTGYAHLYLWDGTASKALTQGSFEVTSIKPGPDGKSFYFRANRQRPSQYDIYRVDRSGKLEQVTNLGGNTGYDLSADGKEIVFLHSTIDHPPEVYLQSSTPGAPARQLTHFTSQEFQAIDWTVPSIVAVPSSHQSRPIPAKLYLPKGGARPGGAAVVFVHGAGYLQNSDEAWSYYYHEFMFHTLLNQLGVTVLDMDYRASAGYGREWRTAIYRQMGTPELEDLQDGVAYLVKEHGVARGRVGVYGGSYGGFMTLMAMFKDPELFACGAALRPVTDWAQYEHEYTARILNTPKEDPESYLRSSPIEFAEGLKHPLLICHGMLDDNVVAQDTVRLTQRLIALEKENWETALYPVEPHGFIEPSSWLDEYRRILKLFRTHLNLP